MIYPPVPRTVKTFTPPPLASGPVHNRYMLPFSGGLFETGVYAPVSRYPTTTNLRSGNTAGTFDTAGRTTDELAARLAELKNMQEEDPWAD